MEYSLGKRRIEFRGDDYFIADNATVIGSVVIENNVSIWFNTVIRGDNDIITIGENSNIQDGSILHTDDNIQLIIGKNVTIGHMAVVHGCIIGDNSLIGIKSVILNRAKIGKNCIIGANTLIPEAKVIPDCSLVLGTPGKIIRTLSQDDLAKLQLYANHYVNNFKRFKRELAVTS